MPRNALFPEDDTSSTDPVFHSKILNPKTYRRAISIKNVDSKSDGNAHQISETKDEVIVGSTQQVPTNCSRSEACFYGEAKPIQNTNEGSRRFTENGTMISTKNGDVSRNTVPSVDSLDVISAMVKDAISTDNRQHYIEKRIDLADSEARSENFTLSSTKSGFLKKQAATDDPLMSVSEWECIRDKHEMKGSGKSLQNNAKDEYSHKRPSGKRNMSFSVRPKTSSFDDSNLHEASSNTENDGELFELQNVGSSNNTVDLIITDPNTDRHGFYYSSKPSTGSQSVMATSSSTLDPGKTDSIEAISLSSENSFAEVRVTQSISQTRESKHFLDSEKTLKSIAKLKQLETQHDQEYRNRILEWDSLISRISKCRARLTKTDAEDPQMFGYKAHKLRELGNERAWKLPYKESSRPKNSPVFQEFCDLSAKGGFSLQYRNNLWYELSGASARAIPGEFQRLLQICELNTDAKITKHISEIDLDLHRTLVSNKYFFDAETSQPGPHFEKLQHVLYAFVAHNTDIGYSQGMNHIAANLLLGITESSHNGTTRLGEEDFFWIFVALIQDILPKYGQYSFYHQESLAFFQTDVSITINHFLHHINPILFSHLKNIHVELEIMVLGWWIGLFTDTVGSLDLWLTMIDGLMLAQDPAMKLISYTLAVFEMLESKLMASKSSDETYEYLRKFKSGKHMGVHPAEFASICAVMDTRLAVSDLTKLRKEQIERE